MGFICICGKEFKAIQGLNGHKTYCKQAGGKDYFDLVKGDSLERFKAGNRKAAELGVLKKVLIL